MSIENLIEMTPEERTIYFKSLPIEEVGIIVAEMFKEMGKKDRISFDKKELMAVAD